MEKEAILIHTFNKKVIAPMNKGEKYFVVRVFRHMTPEEEDPFYYTVQARDATRDLRGYEYIQRFDRLRLPEDKVYLSYYFEVATNISLNSSLNIRDLSLYRVKFTLSQILKLHECHKPDCVEKSFKLGCDKKLEFMLSRHPGHLCKVYKRIRYLDPKTKKTKVHDWKIKVVQLKEPHSEDYLVLKRLPCRLYEVEEYIQRFLGVRFNKRIIPNSLLHLQLQYRDLMVFSQQFYDLNDSRFNLTYKSSYYIQQNIYTNSRIPTLS